MVLGYRSEVNRSLAPEPCYFDCIPLRRTDDWTPIRGREAAAKRRPVHINVQLENSVFLAAATAFAFETGLSHPIGRHVDRPIA